MPLLELTFESGETSLDVRRFDVHESVSGLFAVSIRARSPSADLDLESIVGKKASFRAASGLAYGRIPARLWSGVCSHIEQLQAEATGLSTYQLRIVPTLWLLTQRRNHRIYQHLSIPDIADEILGEWSITPAWSIDRGKYPKLEYKCQYGESDYTFLSRLFEEAGIAFTFPDDEASGSVLTLNDALHLGAPRPAPNLPYVDNPNQAAEQEFVTGVAPRARGPARGAHRPRLRLPQPGLRPLRRGDQAAPPEDRLEQYHYSPGAFLAEGGQGGDTPVADDKGTARYAQNFGVDLAQRALDGTARLQRSIAFESNALDLSTGVILSMTTTRTRSSAARSSSSSRRPSTADPWGASGRGRAAPSSPTRPTARCGGRRSPRSPACRAPSWWAAPGRRSTPTSSGGCACSSPGTARARATTAPRAGCA